MRKNYALLLVLVCLSITAVSQVNLSNGLVAYYPFNGSFNDASGNGHHGTPLNGVTFGTDQWGNANNAASFDGVNDYISVAASGGITPASKFTMSFRFRTTSSNLQVLFSKADYTGPTAPNNFQYQVGIYAGSLLPNNGLFYATNHGATCVTSSALASHYSYGSVPLNNNWYCVVLTFDSGVKKVYMNGSLISTATLTGFANNTSIDSCAGGAFRMGTWWQTDPRWFQGMMDEVRLYNRSLNTQEIDSLCNLVTPPTTELIVNSYAAVVAAPQPCTNMFTVDSATGFKAGDTVVIMQMKGATIDSSNTAAFGSILSYGGAGNYEFNVVSAVSGNNITLRYNVLKTYDINRGRVQLIRVPYFQNYTVSQPHGCMPWNGRKGGVLILNASGTLTLNSYVSASNKGFRTGNLAYDLLSPCAQMNYYYPRVTNSPGAEKGEGIAEVSAARSNGRGALANGGGGGNSSNGGGGGGSNAGVGGIGGNETAIPLCAPAQPTGGLGGVGLTYSNTLNKVFMGGGSGAGHANNNDGGNGANGGGIVIILANQLAGNFNFIKADGGNGSGCVGDCWDGQPGGGGGGSVLLHVNTYTSNVVVSAIGGNGASFSNSNAGQGPNGPGGGGGGGAIWLKSPSIPSQVIGNVSGGAKGLFLNGNNPWGTTDGGAGTMVTGLQIANLNPADTFVNNNLSVNFIDSVILCTSRKFVNLTTTKTAGVSSWSWTFGDGGTSNLQSPTHVYATQGTFSVKLVAVDSNGCIDSMVQSIIIACGDTIINSYAAVLSRGICNNIFTVDTATNFRAGDTVLVIQMKGATIDTSNTASFGSITSYNSAGNYEYNVVQTVSGNNITLAYRLVNKYDIPNGKVQFVKVPSFVSYNMTRGHSCLPWTGSKGGVFAIRAAGTLTLNADINVSGRGFNGGHAQFTNLASCNRTDYFYPPTNNYGGRKGEGIAELSTAMLYGRGALANGGGGGNDFNSGGGGGSNYAAGGLGGNQSSVGPCATTLNIGGVGGRALVSSPFTRAFMGGGGGCGHGDDTAEKPGGNGGGIIFIHANTVVGNGRALRANGNDAPECTAPGVIGGGCANDGGGGGGGGGLIYSTASSLTGSLTVQVRGGKGSNVYVIGDPPVGPGGGGSGGAWAFLPGSAGPGVVFSGTGGAAGILPQYSTTYGAQPGVSGQTYASKAVPQSTTLFGTGGPALAFTDTAISCYGRRMIYTSPDSAGLSFSWFFNGGAGSSTLRDPAYTFPGYGSFIVTLTATDSNGCSGSQSSFVTIPYVHFANAGVDTNTCNGKPVGLTASGGISYAWTPAATLSSTSTASTLASPVTTTTYTVTVVDSKGCIDSDRVTVTVAPPANRVMVTPHDTVICDVSTVQLTAYGGLTYSWSPAAGLSNPNIFNPIATVTGDMTYVVTGMSLGGCISSDTVNIHPRTSPTVEATAEGTGSRCKGVAVLLKATGTAQSYQWAPATYVSNSGNATTYANPPVTTLYTVTGKHSNGCTATDTVTAFVAESDIVAMPAAFTPNGDGLNDDIHPMIFCDFVLSDYLIFNRWGQVVYEGHGSTDTWNGTYKGKDADAGTYNYLITGRRLSDNVKTMYKGNFILVR